MKLANFNRKGRGCGLWILAPVLISLLIAARTDRDYSRASVNQVQGILVFTDCVPSYVYEYVGTVKNGMHLAGSAQYETVRDRLIKKIKNDYPDATGAIFHFNTGSADYADAIKFK